MRFFGKSKEEKMAEAQAKQALKNGRSLKQVLTTLKENREKEIMTGMIANQMKKSYILFNESSVDNNIIRMHLKQLSNNGLSLADDFQFIRSASVRQERNNHNKKSHSKKKNYRKNYKHQN